MKYYSKNPWITLISVPGIVITVTTPGYATVYLTEEQAQQVIFPGSAFTSMPLTLSNEQKTAIQKESGVNVRFKEQNIWTTENGEYVIIDKVLGKHELITYAVGINADGTIKQIEILNYNESYGYEIRKDDWREQFVGKKSSSLFKLDADIKNISGATLSCKHITEGVRRILAMYELILRKNA